jgi:hypothetical protein
MSQNSNNPAQTVEMVQGVRINCVAEQKIYLKAQFEAVNVPVTHDIFTTIADCSEIAQHVKVTLYTSSSGIDLIYNGGTNIDGEAPWSNATAANLFKSCHLDTLGEIPAAYEQNDIGSVLVVRQDKKPLLPIHMEAFVKFCRNISTKTLVNVCKEDFEKYWEVAKGWKGNEYVESPYDV